MRNHLLIALISLILGAPSLAWGGAPELPVGLRWCQSIGEVLERLPDSREMSDDVLDSTVTVWGVEGFLSAIMDDGQLISLRFRAFDIPSDQKKVRSRLVRSYGEGGTSGSTTRWSVGEGVKLSLKLQSEQIFVGWETAPGYCGEEVVKGGLSDQEKADAEAMKDRKAVAWDPYADDIEEDAVKKKVKKKEDEKEEEKKKKKKKSPVGDGDIDW